MNKRLTSPTNQDTPPTTRGRNRVVAETESGSGQAKAADDEQRAGDEDATQDRNVEGDEDQGEQSDPSKKRRRENKTSERYQGEISASCFPPPRYD